MIQAPNSQPILYETRSAGYFREPTNHNFTAYAAEYMPNNSGEGERPWGSPNPQPDAKCASHIIEVDSRVSANAGGDVPFLDALNPDKLNELLAADDLHLSLLSKASEPRVGTVSAVATLSAQGGFRQDTLRRMWHNVRRPSVRLPHGLPPLPRDTQTLARSLHVAVYDWSIESRSNREIVNTSRSHLGAMAAFHALQNVPPETTIQYAHNGRMGGAYRSLLSEAMGMHPYDSEVVRHDNRSFTVSRRVVGNPELPDTILYSLATYISKTHRII